MWNEVASSGIRREKSWSLIDTIKIEVASRLVMWPDFRRRGAPSNTQEARSWRDDKLIFSYIGGVNRIHLVMLRDPWDRDMEWCPAWIDQNELVYSRGPWQDMKIWHECMMAMGIGLHGAIQWYERGGALNDTWVPRVKEE